MFGYINVMSSGWFTNNKEMYEKGEARLKEIEETRKTYAKPEESKEEEVEVQ